MQTTGVGNPQVHKMPRTFVRPGCLKEQTQPLTKGFVAYKPSTRRDIHKSRTHSWAGEGRFPETHGVDPESLINAKVTIDYIRRDPFNTIPRRIVIFKGFGKTLDGKPCLLYVPLHAKNQRHRKLTLSEIHPVIVKPVQEPFEVMPI